MNNAPQNSTTENSTTENSTTPDTDHEPFGPGVTWKQVERRSEANGFHFFDDKTQSFFNSENIGIPEAGSDGNAYGVVSRRYPQGRTQYTVIRTRPDGKTERPHDPDDPHNDPDKEGDGGQVLVFTERAAALKARDALAYHDTAGGYFGKEGGPEAGRVPPEYYVWY